MKKMKIIRTVLDIICTLVVVILLGIAAMYVKGIKPYLMVTGSMDPVIPVGSICFIDTQYSFQELEIQDVIMYQSQNKRVIHRIVEKKEDTYKTKGDANSKVDGADITQDIYLGKLVFSISKFGYFTSKIDSSVDKGTFVTCLIVLFIVDYLMHYAQKQKVPRE